MTLEDQVIDVGGWAFAAIVFYRLLSNHLGHVTASLRRIEILLGGKPDG